jgi:UPF0755 protein
MNAGDVVKEETVVFTIPEGYTAEQVADKLAEAWKIRRQLFSALLIQVQNLKAVDILGIPENKEIRHSLRGVFVPGDL